MQAIVSECSELFSGGVASEKILGIFLRWNHNWTNCILFSNGLWGYTI